MEKYARITGYAAAFALLLGGLALIAGMREGLLFPHYRIQVRFASIGTLMEDDPVKLRGVTVGRVASIRSVGGEAVATLEFFRRAPIPADSRFINYNHSLFGARMVLLVPGDSPAPMDPDAIQQGIFSPGVSETIHRVEELLHVMTEYKRLSLRLESGTDSALSVQAVLARRVYPVLERFGVLVKEMDSLQTEATEQLDRLASASAGMDRLGRDLSAQSDTLVFRADRALTRLALLTSQAAETLAGLEALAAAGQDTTRYPGRALMRRDLYDRALALTHALEDMLKLLRDDGLTDAIHFWRNVHLRWGRPRER